MKKRYTLAFLIQISVWPLILGQYFTYHSNAPFAIEIVKPDSTRVAQTISFFDRDGDGDLDLFLTGLDFIDDFEYWEGIHFFIEMQENTGDRYNPQFGERQELIGFPYPVGYFFASPGDLNNDGKVDFIVGSDIDYIGNQKFLMLINTGTWDQVSFDIIRLDTFGLLDFVPESFFKPELTDLDSDGDLDLLASGFNSAFAEEDGPDIPQFYYAKNRDIRQDVDFVGWYPNPYGLAPSPYSELLTSGDIDNDGDMDLLGSILLIPPDSNNYLLVHLNNPDINDRPAFANPLQSPFGMPTSFGATQLTFPELADLDGDGDLDLFVFEGNTQSSNLKYYENNLCQPTTNELSVVLCEGETVEINGVVYEDAGEFTIHLQNSQQCDSIIHLHITVETIPEVPLEATICEGEVFMIGGDIFTEPGDYMVILTAKNGCDTVVLLTLFVNSVDAQVSQTGNTLTANLSGASYQWINCDTGEDIDNAVSQSYEVTVTGNYAVYITNALGCAAQSECTMVIITSTEADRISGLISVYPNPARNVIYFENDSGLKFSSATLFYSTGKLAGKIIPDEDWIDLSGFIAGVYFLKLENNGIQVIKRLVIL